MYIGAYDNPTSKTTLDAETSATDVPMQATSDQSGGIKRPIEANCEMGTGVGDVCLSPGQWRNADSGSLCFRQWLGVARGGFSHLLGVARAWHWLLSGSEWLANVCFEHSAYVAGWLDGCDNSFVAAVLGATAM